MTTRRPPITNDYQRQNRMQIREQEMLNREMRKRDQEMKDRDTKLKERLRGQYSRKGSLTGTATATRGAALPAAATTTVRSNISPVREYQMEETTFDAEPRNGEIQVFVRETEPAHARQYTIREDEVYSPSPPPQSKLATQVVEQQYQPPVAPQPIAPTNATSMCGPPSGGSGAARKNSTGGVTKTSTLGKVPAYLEQRKAELQYEKDILNRAVEEERKRRQHPPGCTPLTQEEKTGILKGLEAKKRDLMADINKYVISFPPSLFCWNT